VGALVIGLGQRAAGDDAIGIAIVEALRSENHDGVRTEIVQDATELVQALSTPDPVILVDALVGVGASPGHVEIYEVDAVSRLPQSGLSTHGIGVGQAIALSRTLYPEAACPRILIVGVHIDPPSAYRFARSPEVDAALPRALEIVLSLCTEFSEVFPARIGARAEPSRT
jgi:hydrogenase maturation protease